MRNKPYLLEIGRKIKATRLSSGRKIREIAERANVSKGLISKIENGRTVPSLPVLISIISALDIDLGEFFSHLSPFKQQEINHVKAQEYSLVKKEKSKGFQYYKIHDHEINGISFTSNLLIIEPNATRAYVTTDGYESIFVLDGCLDYYIGDEMFKLIKGDSLFFNGRIPHFPKNSSEDIAKLFIVYILA